MVKGYLTALVASVIVGLSTNPVYSGETARCIEAADGYAFVENGTSTQENSPKMIILREILSKDLMQWLGIMK